MTQDAAFKEDFQYFSLNVPTSFPSAGASDPLAAKHLGSPNSYLRLGDTPTPADLNGQDEPGIEQRSELVGTPEWPRDLYRSFAPDNSDTVPNGDVLRVNAGTSEPFDVDGNFYKNVGWLDHCNGHRVSTTHGDKVEVITGNYKLVVLGREGDAQKSTGLDMSGGHTSDWAQTPGAMRTITAEANSFKVTNVTDSGHGYNVFEGFDSYHLVGGSSNVSVMGGDNDRTEKGGGPADLVVDAAWANTIFDSDFAATVINIDAGDLGSSHPWPSLSETQDLKANAAAFSVGPADFEDVTALPKADKIIEARSGTTVSEWTSADNYEERIAAGKATETLDADNITCRITASRNIDESFECGLYVEKFFGNRKNITRGDTETEIHVSLNQLGISVAGFKQELALGLAQVSFEGYVSLDATISLAALRYDLSYGWGVEQGPVEFEWPDAEMRHGMLELYNKMVKLHTGTMTLDDADLSVRL